MVFTLKHEAHTLVLNLCIGLAIFPQRLPAHPEKKVLGSHATIVKPLKYLKNKNKANRICHQN